MPLDDMTRDGRLYQEEQRFRQWWVWAVVAVVCGLAWWAMVQQVILRHPFGDKPMSDWGVVAFWLIMGLGLPLFMWGIRLTTVVLPGKLIIRYWPLTKRIIRLRDIQEAQVRTYRPLKEYGGWGIKGWSRHNMAYNMAGDRGVQLVLRDGRRILVGSQRPEELALAIDSQRS